MKRRPNSSTKATPLSSLQHRCNDKQRGPDAQTLRKARMTDFSTKRSRLADKDTLFNLARSIADGDLALQIALVKLQAMLGQSAPIDDALIASAGAALAQLKAVLHETRNVLVDSARETVVRSIVVARWIASGHVQDNVYPKGFLMNTTLTLTATITITPNGEAFDITCAKYPEFDRIGVSLAALPVEAGNMLAELGDHVANEAFSKS